MRRSDAQLRRPSALLREARPDAEATPAEQSRCRRGSTDVNDPAAESLLAVSGLVTEISRGDSVLRPVDDITFSIAPGETVGLVGESGSGKTMVANSILRLLPANVRIAAGSVRFAGRDLVQCAPAEMRALRGNEIGMVFQNPMTSLNPRMTIGDQVAESVLRHQRVNKKAARNRAVEVLGMVGLPSPARRYDEYPHRLSGGLRQRVIIAMALACDPALLIADEPTTALDVTIQAEILDLIDKLKSELGMAVLLVTHDMGVIAGRSDRVLVMYAGRIVEQGSTEAVLLGARHRYTEALLNAIPKLDQDPSKRLLSIPGRPPDLNDYGPGCRFSTRCAHVTDACVASLPVLEAFDRGHEAACVHPAEQAPENRTAASQRGPVTPTPALGGDAVARPDPVLQLANVSKSYRLRTSGGLRRGKDELRAVHDVTLDLWPGETLGIVGESGSGKSTLARMIVGLEQPTTGEVTFRGTQLTEVSARKRRRLRRGLQLMFQDNYSALDPRMRVGTIVAEPMVIQGDGDRSTRRERARSILTEVGLRPDAGLAYPHEFSGGQRQRINLARALVLRPSVIVADEPVSALDVSVRSQVLNMMKDLQRDTDLAYIVISHDLAVVRYLADRIGVMFKGKLVEIGDRESTYERPAHPYTVRLLNAVPSLDARPQPSTERINAVVDSALSPGKGCPFAQQCPRVQEICVSVEPMLAPSGAGQKVACHFPVNAG